MDRAISKEEQQKELRKKIIKYSAIAVITIIIIGILISLMRSSVDKKDLSLSTVDKGIIEVSVSASGKVVPAFEEIINSPIDTRIVEVYKKGGDSVDIGTPIFKLDLQSTETEYKKLQDEEQMKSHQLEQFKVNNRTKMNDLAMQIKVSAMKLNRMTVELRNERYLDSLGAGTTDKVREVELNYNVAQLELEQLKQQYKNDQQIRSPRKAILTYINNQVGMQVSKGSQVAIISDLSHFKVDGEIADSYGDRISTGSKAIVKIGIEKLPGIVSNVIPIFKNGVVALLCRVCRR